MPDSAQNLGSAVSFSLLHSTAHDGTAAKSSHWLDDKKIEIDTIIKMPPHHLSYGVLALLSLSVSLKQNLTLRRLMSYMYGAPILDVSRSHTTTQHSR